MEANSPIDRNLRMTRNLFRAGGLFCLGVSLLYNEWSLSFIDPRPFLPTPPYQTIRSSQVFLLLTGVVLVLVSEAVRLGSKSQRAREKLGKPLVANIAVFVVLVLCPVVLAESILRPFTLHQIPGRKTTIFIKDEVLGWRLRPGARDKWGGFPIEINAKGLRGPEIPYARIGGAGRILYLGDSVTFGYRLGTWEETFPYLAERAIEEKMNRSIETINAGVDGYSPWQQLIYLEKEGIRYQPDIVLICFVLNDVTERFGLVRFGGTGAGYQMSKTALTFVDRIRNVSAIVNLAHRISVRMDFGKDRQKGAVEKEVISARSLVYNPDSTVVKGAWDATLEDLSGIIEICRERRIKIGLIVFPYRFQMKDSSLAPSPQIVLRSFAEKENIPMLDLMPPLQDYLRQRHMPPERLYTADEIHFSPEGNRVIADIVTDFLTGKIGLGAANPAN